MDDKLIIGHFCVFVNLNLCLNVYSKHVPLKLWIHFYFHLLLVSNSFDLLSCIHLSWSNQLEHTNFAKFLLILWLCMLNVTKIALIFLHFAFCVHKWSLHQVYQIWFYYPHSRAYLWWRPTWASASRHTVPLSTVHCTAAISLTICNLVHTVLLTLPMFL